MTTFNTLPEEHHITEAEWKILDGYLAVLLPFKQVLKLFEGDKYITANWVLPGITVIRGQLKKFAEQAEDSISKRMGTKMLENFEKRWGMMALNFSLVRSEELGRIGR